MGLKDFEVFIQECLRSYDASMDLTSGSPVDAKVIQPVLRRLGTDPFTVDAATFITTRLAQEFPDLAMVDGDAISDGLVKPALLLFDPLIRENQRISNSLSLKDPTVLTTDEADALGANLIATRPQGDYARTVVRAYFSQAQNMNISQTNFCTSRSGLHFFPTTVQSLKSSEMALNKEGDLYYFDFNVVAEDTGDVYNIEVGEIVTIANVPAAVRVTNKNRARFGLPAQDAATFVGNLAQSLTERSRVTLRGIKKLTDTFPEATGIAVVGFNDPEMQRDVMRGGGLGAPLAYGVDATPVADGESMLLTRRVSMASADFSLLGSFGPSAGYVVTLFGMFTPGTPQVRDVEVTEIIDATTLALGDQSLFPGVSGCAWTIRKKELTLSSIPGGILFPSGPNGDVQVADDTVHVGGCTDVFVKAAALDTSSLVLDNITDDRPLLSGFLLTTSSGVIKLEDLRYTDATYWSGSPIPYYNDDDTYKALKGAKDYQYSLQILDGVNAGIYRVLGVTQVLFQAPVLELDPAPAMLVSGAFRWKLLDVLDIDLIDPKETRIQDTTGISIQNVPTFTSSPATNFQDLGVSPGDVLRLLDGPDLGDYQVQSIAAPFFTQITVDRPFISTTTGLRFVIFRPNLDGGAKRPVVRISSIDLLDSSMQPIGTKIPYAKPVGVRSRSFQNVGVGVKKDINNATLGIISYAVMTLIAGENLVLKWGVSGSITIPNTLGGVVSASDLVTELNLYSQSVIHLDVAVLLTYGGTDYVGIIPLGDDMEIDSSSGSMLLAAFATHKCGDICSIPPNLDWTVVTPKIDPDQDVVWVRDGTQTGFANQPLLDPVNTWVLHTSAKFAPEGMRAVQVGSRSIGSARLLFLEPTSMEVDQETVFSTTLASGVALNFKPDSSLYRTLIPAAPNGAKPLNGDSTGWPNFVSTGADFVKSGVQIDDILVIDFQPIFGSVALTDPVLGLALKDLVISLDEQPDYKITFVGDVATVGAVSRDAVAKQINAAVGLTICSIEETTPGVFNLKFNPTLSLVIRKVPLIGGTTYSNLLLGFSNISDTNNVATSHGEFPIIAVTSTSLRAVPFITPTATNQQFSIKRKGAQRISSTEMEANKADAGLYFWDVELISEGVGNTWNIGSELDMTVVGYRSDGYYLFTGDIDKTFSTTEDVTLSISRSILEIGVDDDLSNATQLSGQNLRVNYEYSSLVQNTQAFISSAQERVTNSSMLMRHLVPHLVRFDMHYRGGSVPSVVVPDITSLILNTAPEDTLEVGTITDAAFKRGATGVTTPVNLYAIVYNLDRTVSLVQSQNALSTTRLATFTPDLLNVVQDTT